MTYKLVKLKEVLEQYKKLITLSSDTEYKQVTIKMYWKWVILRWIQKWFDIQTKNQYLVKKWQFIISKIDARNWAFWKIPDDLDWAIISNSFASFDIDTKLLNIDYLILFSKTDDFVNACIWKSEWTTNRQSVKIDDFLELEIPLPSLEEQEKIVKKLESINSKIEKVKLAKEKNNIKILREQILKQAIEWKLVAQNLNDEPASILLEKIKQEKERCIKEKMIQKPKEKWDIKEEEKQKFDIPSNWKLVKVVDLAFVTKLAGFEFTKYIKLEDEWEIPVIRAQNVKQWYLDLTNIKFISEKISNLLNRCALYKKSILVTFIWAWIWDTAIFDKKERWHLAPNVAKLEPFNKKDEEYLDIKYLNFYLMSSIWNSEIFKHLKHTAQPSLSMWTIRDIIIPLPPLEEQKRIVEKIEEFEEKLNKLDKLQTKQLKELEALKNAVLDKALSGELI